MCKVSFIFLLLFAIVYGQPCNDSLSADISNGTFFHDGSVFYNGVNYPKDLVFEKNVSGDVKTLGCVCKLKRCLRKCCPMGSVIYQRHCIENPEKDILLNEGLNISFLKTYKRTVNLTSGEFGLLRTQTKGTPFYCGVYKEPRRWYIQEDGKLFIDIPTNDPPWQLHGPDKYCVDTFITEDQNGQKDSSLDALVCFAEYHNQNNFLINSSCMMISCVFILATCAVYAWLPELRNLHGRVLMAYLLSLFVAFLFMSTMQILLAIDNTTRTICNGLTFIIYFAFEAAFFWLNVMCFDIWWTFSGKRGLSLQRLSTRARFNAYAAYAFGIPTLLTILLAALEFSGLPPNPWLPLMRNQGCFLYGNARLIYLYGPMTLLCVINMVFFVLTAVKIIQIKKQTAVLKSKESSTHDTQRTDKQRQPFSSNSFHALSHRTSPSISANTVSSAYLRNHGGYPCVYLMLIETSSNITLERLLLYVKLFLVMGINWILEVLSAMYPEAQYFWNVIDAYNVLIGVTIFFIFVCKRKIFRLIKKRYKQMRGDPMSRTQTTSSRTTTTKEEYPMGSVKNHSK